MGYMTEKEFSEKMEKIKLKNKQVELKNKLKAEKNKYKKSNFSKMKTSNAVLIAAIIAVILFTIACLYIQYTTSVEISSTLITFWYSFWTVEIVSLAGIKVSKVFKDYKSSLNIGDDELDVESEIENTNIVG